MRFLQLLVGTSIGCRLCRAVLWVGLPEHAVAHPWALRCSLLPADRPGRSAPNQPYVVAMHQARQHKPSASGYVSLRVFLFSADGSSILATAAPPPHPVRRS